LGIGIRSLAIAVAIVLLPAFSHPSGFDGMKVLRVSIEGNRSFSDRKLRKLMSTKKSSLIFRREFDSVSFERDLDAIVAFYRSNGFLEARVLGKEVRPDGKGRGVYVIVRISEGRRFHVGEVRFEGNELLPEDELLRLISLRPGEVYRPPRLDEDRRLVQVAYAEKGLINAKVVQAVDIDAGSAAVDITYRISEGRPVRIRNIIVKGARKVNRSIIRKGLRFRGGEIYSYSKVVRSQGDLFQTGLFKWVRIYPEVRTASECDVVVELEEQPGGEINFGVGYGTLDSFRGSAEVIQRNWLGRGIALGSRLRLSKLRRSGEVLFTYPWLFNTRTNLDLRAFYRFLDEPSFTVEGEGINLHLTSKLGPRTTLRGGCELSRNLVLKLKRGEIPRHLNRTGLISVDVKRDSRNNLLSPTFGSFFQFKAEFADKNLGGTSRFARGSLLFRRYWSNRRKLTLAVSYSLRLIVPIKGRQEIPVYERFFAGGLRSIRGFKESSIGVYGEDEDPGGLVMLVCQNELRWPLWKKLGGAIFVDFGNVWRERRDVKSSDLRVGFGAGLRLVLPIGIIYLDLAWPQKSPEPVRDTRYYIGIGQSF